MLHQAHEALGVCAEVGDVPAEDMPPRVGPVHLVLGQPAVEYHRVYHDIDGDCAEGVDVGRELLLGAGPGLGASPELVAQGRTYDGCTRFQNYCIFQI